LREWLAERFCPTTLVFSSAQLRETLLKQSSLSPAELLRPFAIIGDLNNVALQTCEKNQPFRLQKFRVNFIDSHKLDR
jgi:trafficking protein particle complex subunit 8